MLTQVPHNSLLIQRHSLPGRPSLYSPGHSLFPGSGAGEVRRLITPFQTPSHRDWRTTNVIFWGRRGQGKSLSMMIMAALLRPIFKRMHWRIQANINIHPALVDFCAPNLPDLLVEYPDRARHSLILVDEIVEFTPSGRAMSKYNLNAASLARMLRKLQCEIVCTTQFPTDVDRRLLRQMDVFVLCEAHVPGDARRNPMSARKAYVILYVFDIWGQFPWGSNGEAAKYWPPPKWMADKVLVFRNLHKVWDFYNTNELVMPQWREDSGKDRIIRQQWDVAALDIQEKAREREEASEAQEHLARRPSPGLTVANAPRVRPPETFEELLAEHAGRSGQFVIDQRLIRPAQQLGVSVATLESLRSAIQAAGYLVSSDGRQWYASLPN